ncbi:MAG TPA: N,N-dimethylformamidase beta subunit family domain-containing protein [Tepidisphaeraceae bacterium]
MIHRENAKGGTRDWLLTSTRVDPKTKYRCPWIEGYCSRTSVKAGETISFHVSTNPASRFRIDLYRLGYYQGQGGRHMTTLGPFAGVVQPDPPVGPNRVRECRWEPCATLAIPGDWPSGVYVGKLTEEREKLQSYVIFIVRDDRPADLVYQCSDTTWQAYNRWPSQFALYDDGTNPWYWGPGVDVSFDRPYGKYCQILDQPLSIGSGDFFCWEFPLVFWLEQHGYDVTYISNLDTHADGAALARGKGVLSGGHDEYYSIEMFENLRRAIGQGLNVAFLSGNTCCGRIDPRPSFAGVPHRVFGRIDRFGPREPEELKHFPTMSKLPFSSPNENTLIGARSTGYITGGADYACSIPDHWLFEGTGMKRGDSIPGLIGWEWHGDPATDLPGLAVVSTGPTQDGSGNAHGAYASTIYDGPRGNVVFNASTCWWGDGLAEPPGYVRPAVYTRPRGPDARAGRITQNLLARFQSTAQRL